MSAAGGKRTCAGRWRGGASSGCSWGVPVSRSTSTTPESRSFLVSPTSPWAASSTRSSTPSPPSTRRSQLVSQRSHLITSPRPLSYPAHSYLDYVYQASAPQQ